MIPDIYDIYFKDNIEDDNDMYTEPEFSDDYVDAIIEEAEEKETLHNEDEQGESRYLIVARNKAMIEWLRKKGITGKVKRFVKPEEVKGKIVVGVIPLYIAVHADALMTIDVPNLPPSMIGRKLTLEDMEKYGARLNVYKITKYYM